MENKSKIFRGSSEMFRLEYPHLEEYGKAILNSFWIPEHFTYDRDVNDYNINLTKEEQEVVKRLVLCIAQIENKVKSMWSRIDMRLGHPVIANVGHIFAMNETVHQDSYKKIIDLLGLVEEFNSLSDNSVIVNRVKYLSKYLAGVNSRSDKEFTKSLILFTILVENCALFSYFAGMASFNKYKSLFNNFNSIVMASSREEILHGQFGAELVKIIRQENPEWFDQEMEDKIIRNVKKAYKAECEILDWVFEKGDLDFLKKEDLKNYLKHRFNTSLVQLGYEPIYEEEDIKVLEFFDRSVKSSISFDFFNEKSSEYDESNKITEDDWV